MPVVLDCSVSMAWYFKDLLPEVADEYYAFAARNGVIVPAIWQIETLNVIAITERRGRATTDDAMVFLGLIDLLTIEIEPPHPRSAWLRVLNLARTHQLTVYDASYLEVAIRHRVPLLSRDKALVRAANSAGVEIYVPVSQH